MLRARSTGGRPEFVWKGFIGFPPNAETEDEMDP